MPREPYMQANWNENSQRTGVLVRDGPRTSINQWDNDSISPPPIPPIHRAQSVDSLGSSRRVPVPPPSSQTHQVERKNSCNYCNREFPTRVLFDHMKICEKKK